MDGKEIPASQNTSEFDPKGLTERLAEVRAYEAIATTSPEEAGKQLDLAKNVPGARAARLRLRIGQKAKAEELAVEAVKNSVNQVAPLATLVEALAQNGKQEEARKQFGELRVLAAAADLDIPLLARLNPLAKEAGCTTADWRNPAPSPSDIGPRPPLDTLGPLRWSPTAVPGFTLRDSHGVRVSLADYAKQGKPVVVIFYLGTACLKCMEQLNAFAPLRAEFEKAGIAMLAVSTDTPESLKRASEQQDFASKYPFPLLSDKDSRVFRAFRAYDDFESLPMHGTFLIDAQGQLRWQDIRFEPFTDARFVLNEAKRLFAQTPSGQN